MRPASRTIALPARLTDLSLRPAAGAKPMRLVPSEYRFGRRHQFRAPWRKAGHIRAKFGEDRIVRVRMRLLRRACRERMSLSRR